MTIQVSCQNCQRTLNAKDELAGRRARCQKCGAAVQLPGVAQTPAGVVHAPSFSANKPSSGAPVGGQPAQPIQPPVAAFVPAAPHVASAEPLPAHVPAVAVSASLPTSQPAGSGAARADSVPTTPAAGMDFNQRAARILSAFEGAMPNAWFPTSCSVPPRSAGNSSISLPS